MRAINYLLLVAFPFIAGILARGSTTKEINLTLSCIIMIIVGVVVVDSWKLIE
jgi:hypothetical protein